MMKLPLSFHAVVAALSGMAWGGVPLSAQVQAEAPAAEPPFRVFFDWGEPKLSGDTKAMLDKVAGIHAASPGASLRLEGHTDRSGSAAVNRRSAWRRAAEVRDYLVAKGIPASSISLIAHGEARPLIPTEDGVREVQNRRVEIVLVPAPGR